MSRYSAWDLAYYLNKKINKNLNNPVDPEGAKLLLINGSTLWYHYTDNGSATDKRVK